MGVDSTDAYGKPTFNDAFALPGDLQVAVNYADTFANIRRGTSAERQSLPAGKQRPGMLFVETDNNNRVLATDGSGGWTTPGSTPWMNLTLSTGWSAVSGHTPRGRLIGGVVYLEGAVQRDSGGLFTSILTVPAAFRFPGVKTTFIGASVASRSGTYAMSELYIDQTGVVKIQGYTSIDSNVGWTVPIGSFYVLDQAA